MTWRSPRRGVPGRRPGAGRTRRRRRAPWSRRAEAAGPTPSRRGRGRRRRRGRPDRVTMRARRRRAGREPRDPAGPVAAGVSRAGPGGRLAGRASSSTSGTGDFSGMVLRRPFSLNTADAATRHRHDPLPRHRPRARTGSPACGRATRRPARAARPAVRGRSADAGTCCWWPAGWAWPASGCWPTRRSATVAR